MTNSHNPIESVQQILNDERSAATNEHIRLQAIIDSLAGQKAILATQNNQLQTQLHQAWHDAGQWQSLQSDGESIAEDLADLIDVRLPQYQDDNSGRHAICVEQDELAIDLTGYDHVPATVIAVKTLSDTESETFRCRLQAKSLRYTIEPL